VIKRGKNARISFIHLAVTHRNKKKRMKVEQKLERKKNNQHAINEKI